MFNTSENMGKLILILLLAPWISGTVSLETTNETDMSENSTDPNKDMYVIHAMVYQVGILTNKTDNETANLNTTGNQEAVTFYHTNGSHVDLSKIANPLLTNVTAQSMVGVAPIPSAETGPSQLPWSTLNHLANSVSSASEGSSHLKTPKRSIETDVLEPELSLNNLYRSLFKREAPGTEASGTPVAVHSGAAVIPAAAGVQSIGLPPLLSLNNNMSQIPVPIPNTSVVHYAKINTLVSKT